MEIVHLQTCFDVLTRRLLAWTATLVAVANMAGAQAPPMDLSSPSPGPLEAMPRALETDFALSALPPHLRNDATVFRLDPTKGYVLERKGTNGFACLVERTEWARADFRNDIYTPLCYDAEGAARHLRVYMDTAELRAQGRTAELVRREIERRYQQKADAYTAPTRPGLSYMVAPMMRTYPSPNSSDKHVMTMSLPHLMFYAPNASAADIGETPPPSPYPFILEPGPHGYMIVLLGEAERARIVADNADLLKRLCDYRAFLCLKP